MTSSGVKYSRVFLDFDGTIVDSNRMKQECVIETLREFGFDEIFAAKFSQHFIQLSGRSRHEKFRNWFGDEAASAMVEHYSRLVVDRLYLPQFIRGADRFLQQLSTCGIDIYVVSGSRSSEIIDFLNARTSAGASGCRVFGDDKSKAEWFYELGVGESDIFFGDSEEDLLTADAVGCRFVYVNSGLVRIEVLSSVQNWILVNDFYDSEISEEIGFASSSY